MKKQHSMNLAIGGVMLLTLLAGGIPSFGQPEEDDGLAALMQRNRQHFSHVVDMAFFKSLEQPLQTENYQWIQVEAQAIAALARQARLDHSRGEGFEEIARSLEKHAGEVATHAEGENLPDINVHIGEMAEYCAECHNTYRW
jgi:cytochrome c556